MHAVRGNDLQSLRWRFKLVEQTAAVNAGYKPEALVFGVALFGPRPTGATVHSQGCEPLLQGSV
jgi:hypothetical protein